MRWLFRAILTIVILCVIVVAGILLMPSDRIARIAESQFAARTGGTLKIDGDVSPTLFPRLGVRVEDVTVLGDDGTALLEAQAMDLGVGLSALMGGDLAVEAFRIDAPVIRLERKPSGDANWEFLTGGEASEPSEPLNVSVPLAEITNARVEYIDDAAGQNWVLSELDLELRMPQMSGAANVQAKGLLQGKSFEITSEIGSVQGLLDGEVHSIDVNGNLESNSVSFKGRVGLEPLQADGRIDLGLLKHSALFDLLGQSPPRIPIGMGQQVSAGGQLTYTKDQIFLRGAQITLDQNALAGDFDVVLGGTPQVTAQVTAGQLDFSAMSTDTSEGDGAANAGAGGWSDARIDVSGLSAVNGDFTLSAEGIDLGSVKLGKSKLSGKLDQSRLVLDIPGVSVFDGNVAGQFVVNGRNGLSVRGDFNAQNVAMQKLLADFAGFDRLVTDGQLNLNFLASGDTMRELMQSIDGDGAMNLAQGALLGLDIAGMIKNLDTSFQGDGEKTVFNDITASFVITDGVLQNSDLNFDAELLTATGEGSLDLGAQTIDYRLLPVALAKHLETGIRVPVLIQGPWSNIRFRPDLKSLIDTELEEEKERLKAAAKAKEEELRAKARAKEEELKAKAAAKLQEELGVTAQEGQSAEDALKEGLENKAKEALKGLFQRN